MPLCVEWGFLFNIPRGVRHVRDDQDDDQDDADAGQGPDGGIQRPPRDGDGRQGEPEPERDDQDRPQDVERRPPAPLGHGVQRREEEEHQPRGDEGVDELGRERVSQDRRGEGKLSRYMYVTHDEVEGAAQRLLRRGEAHLQGAWSEGLELEVAEDVVRERRQEPAHVVQ